MSAKNYLLYFICILGLTLTGVCSLVRADSVLVFNEIMYNPSADQSENEWVELYNQMAVDIDISGWSLAGAIDYTFPEGTFMPGGSYLVIASMPSELGGISPVFGPFTGKLSNSGELVELRSGSGRLMDYIEYSDKDNWPVGADGSGATLAKKARGQASIYAENWSSSSARGGTPGQDNFPVIDLRPIRTEMITVSSFWSYSIWGDLGEQWSLPGYNTQYFGTGQAGFSYGLDAGSGDREEIPTLFSTGMGDNGLPLSPGSYDNHYELVSSGSSLIAMANHPAWLANDSLSQWIGWSGNGTDNQPAGNFSVRTTFSLTDFDPDSAEIIAYISADNGVDDILVNGVSTGITAAFYDSWAGPYIINSGFVAGDNQLVFNYRNDGTTANPAGLRVRLSGTAAKRLSNAALASCPQTSYFRQQFSYDPVDNTQAELKLNGIIDDGAVFYLNGQEIYRYNMPAGSVAFSTPAQMSITELNEFGPIVVPANSLVAGDNVLAVEVHQAAGGTNDLYFQTELSVVETPIAADDSLSIAFNELSAVNDGGFWLEIVNYGQEQADLTGAVISLDGIAASEYIFPATVLPAGDYLVLNQAELGFSPIVNDKLYLYLPGGELLADAVLASGLAQARNDEGRGRWASPANVTPGLENVFDISDDIVINEIMYHKGDIPGIPAVNDITKLIEKGCAVKVIVPQVSLGTQWTGGDEPFNDSAWLSGTTGIGYDNVSDYLGDIGTNIQGQMKSINSTFYARIPFNYTSDHQVNNMTLHIKYDDGFIAYLNGMKIAERNAPSEPVWTSGATSSHESYDYESIDVSAYISALKVGGNILAIHGLNYGANSSDLLIMPELLITEEISSAIPVTESEEEWIELYNRGDSLVNLTGWELGGDISFEFDDNTYIAPGEYLVVARDQGELAALWPALDITGDFTGRLKNSVGNVILLDDNDNIADEVKYFDGSPWPDNADGSNASLELCNPYADNNTAQSWLASNEFGKSSWQTYTYRAVASASSISAPDNQWRDFVLGMLDAGELLIDDISVIEDPDGESVQLLQNGNFEAIPGEKSWRFLGNHRHTEVIVDPTASGNHVLRLVSTGNSDHMHNHIETTLANGRSVSNGKTYEITFRARWVNGSNQLNSRLYFTRLAQTSIITRPQTNGTPGAVNSCFIANPGPVFSGMNHFPVVPQTDEDVRVSACVSDPSGVAGVNLCWRLNGESWNYMPMTLTDDCCYEATIPGQMAGSVVQFYLAAVDNAAALSVYPQGGPDSRALFRVEDNMAATNGLHNMRILTTVEDDSWLHTPINVMSNDRIGATVIYDESEVFYNVGIRLKGSQHHRTPANEVGFNVGFNADNLFRGVHKTVAIDRSEGVGFGQREMLINQAMNHAGTVVSKYSDLVKVMPLRAEHTSTAELQLARLNDEFLNSQFENGSDGYLYEYELVYYPLTTDNGTAEGYKLPLPDIPVGVGVYDLGADKESYRNLYLAKNNRSQDAYESLMYFCSRFGISSPDFYDELESLIDVDIWLESFAIATACGAGDNYGGDNSSHNAMFYVRPEDGRVLYFPHDLDHAYDQYRSVVPNSD
ncbi:MAG: lamin tail domain-containing protein, partial [Sedimentisphaerales bacterium]|nr:lamin tail domain-containing protein [Sedimentisphaerales bacterium]